MIKDVLEKYKERIPVRVLAELLADIDEAEAKWEKEHKSYDVEKVVEQIHDYFCKVIDKQKGDTIPLEILEYNKAICEIVRKGGVE